MGDRRETARYLESWQDEVDSAAEYRAMAAGEPDPRLAKVYTNLAAMEEAHVGSIAHAGASVRPRRPSWRSRVLGGTRGDSGRNWVRATIAAKESVDQNAYLRAVRARLEAPRP